MRIDNWLQKYVFCHEFHLGFEEGFHVLEYLWFMKYWIVLLFCVGLSAQSGSLISPPNLKKGDTIAIVATARKVDLKSIESATVLLKEWGFEVIIGKTIGKEQNQLAGADWFRATDLQEMLDNPAVKAIWTAKGGYGNVKIIDRLDFKKFKKKPKWIMGFSDTTVLHQHVNNLGYQTLHSFMAISAKSASWSAKESLKKALTGQDLKYDLPKDSLNREGKASGILVGGNLSVIYSLLGSDSETDPVGKILFIEDLDEYLYHVDRMMMNLKRNGYFKKIKGLVVGGMTSMRDNEIPWGSNAIQIIQEITKEYTFPIIYNFPAGHIKDNRTLIMGRKAELTVGKSGSELKFYD